MPTNTRDPGGPARYAAIDVGTNSVKLLVAECAGDGRWVTIRDGADVTRLGEGLAESGEISPAATERTAHAIAAMAADARSDGTRAIAAVGTAAFRVARNRDAVVTAIEDLTRIRIEVIAGEEESRLAYLAATSGVGSGGGSLAVFDTGGGSTQLTFGHGDRVDERFSVNVGAVRYTERFGLARAVDAATLEAASAAISADLVRLDGRAPVDTLVAMGGAITNIAAVSHGLAIYDPDIVQGSVVDRAEIDRQVELYRTSDLAARQLIVGLQPARADIILAGACIVRAVMDKLGREALTVSDRGLRHGLLEERFGEEANRPGGHAGRFDGVIEVEGTT